MFDAVRASVERRRAAIAGRRPNRCNGAKLGTEYFNFANRRRGLLDRERTLLDRAGEEADGHRTTIEIAARY